MTEYIKVKEGELVKFIREFADLIAPIVKVSSGLDGIINGEETLALWMQFPDSSYSPMFLGWLLAAGWDINSFSPNELEKAVQIASVGENKNVMFDWLGDLDAENKPH